MVLLSSGIINVRDQWPLSDRDIYRFSENKYGIAGLTEIKFYETTEVKDSQGRLILPRGKVVDSNFTIPNPSNSLITLNPVAGITNYEYEVIENNKKRSIYLLKSGYLQQYVNDLRRVMYYEKSSQYVNKKLIRTENVNIKSP